MLRRSAMIVSFGVIASAGAVAAVSAVNFTDRPIRVIVSVPPGGGVDTSTRIVTDKMRLLSCRAAAGSRASRLRGETALAQ